VVVQQAISQGDAWAFQHIVVPLVRMFLGPGSAFYLPSLSSALFVAVAFLAWKRRGKRDVKLKVLIRALFPKRLFRSASSRVDFVFLVCAVFLTVGAIGWAVLSGEVISAAVTRALVGSFGALPRAPLSDLVCQAIVTVLLFLAYELAYWTDHYLSHRIPFLWEFHKVHHTAEVLTPITNARVHPVDTAVFANFLAVFIGGTAGILNYVLGRPILPFMVGGTNVILVFFAFTFLHLQHSHIWIATTGSLGRVLLSPAHHQIHHSADVQHFDKNFGSCLALWDWMFGTLRLPTHEREPLAYGIISIGHDPHTVMGAFLKPFPQALARLRPGRFSSANSPERNVLGRASATTRQSA
jgi:sterol desaturase/sphingolipid hydroxylase (fatty acid hydroxylase superfamily)